MLTLASNIQNSPATPAAVEALRVRVRVRVTPAAVEALVLSTMRKLVQMCILQQQHATSISLPMLLLAHYTSQPVKVT